MSRLCVVAAGGTGGHMFPAEALAREMAARGWRVALATDARGEAYAQGFPAEERLALDAATGRGPLGLFKAGLAIGRGVMQARGAFARLDADMVIGFGGYPSAPALVAAVVDRRPTLIHEQNAVLGRTNRTLAPFVTRVASAFETLEQAPQRVKAAATVTGNPVRPAIAALADRVYSAPVEGPIRVIVTGGSQGARLLSQAVPQALAALPQALRARLEVAQQSRAETIEEARRTYAAADIRAEVEPFFTDMAERLAQTHLLIGRAGASTCSELAVTATPSLLIPLKIAMDDHQTLNAADLARRGAAVVVAEDEASVAALTERLSALLNDPARLRTMSDAARGAARLDAAQRLADLAESIA